MNGDQIEKAARALYADINPGHAKGKGWDDVMPRWQDSYRCNAQAAWAAFHPTITTAEELDALPRGSVILDSIGESFQRTDVEGLPSLWSSSDIIPAGFMHLPATVLHIPCGTP